MKQLPFFHWYRHANSTSTSVRTNSLITPYFTVYSSILYSCNKVCRARQLFPIKWAYNTIYSIGGSPICLSGKPVSCSERSINRLSRKRKPVFHVHSSKLMAHCFSDRDHPRRCDKSPISNALASTGDGITPTYAWKTATTICSGAEQRSDYSQSSTALIICL